MKELVNLQSVETKAIYHQMFWFVRITLKTNILINRGIYKTGFFTQKDQQKEN